MKIKSSLVPEGWSNDPRRLNEIGSTTPFFEYDLTPNLASDAAIIPRRYLVTSFGRSDFWIPSTPELLYVTECYNLKGVLQRISGGFELQSNCLDPLNLQHNPLYDTDLSL